MTTIDPTVGPLVGPWDVEQAVLTTLRDWVPFYLYRLEDYQGITQGTLKRPPADESYYGGEDFDTYQQALLPSYIVVVTPGATPEREGNGYYGQIYEVQVAALVMGDLEDDTRKLASFYGSVGMAAIVQHGSLGGFAGETVMTHSPQTFFPLPDERRIARSVTTYNCWIPQVINDQLGPVTWPGLGGGPPSDPSQQLPPWTTIEETILEVNEGPLPGSTILPDPSLLP